MSDQLSLSTGQDHTDSLQASRHENLEDECEDAAEQIDSGGEFIVPGGFGGI